MFKPKHSCGTICEKVPIFVVKSIILGLRGALEEIRTSAKLYECFRMYLCKAHYV